MTDIRDQHHSRLTFEDTLVDYFSHHGIAMSARAREKVVRHLFKPKHALRPICALHYGNSMLCAAPTGAQQSRIESIVWLDFSASSPRLQEMRLAKSGGAG